MWQVTISKLDYSTIPDPQAEELPAGLGARPRTLKITEGGPRSQAGSCTLPTKPYIYVLFFPEMMPN